MTYTTYPPPHEKDNFTSMPVDSKLMETWCKRLGIPMKEEIKLTPKYVSIYSCNKCHSKVNMNYLGSMLVCSNCDNFVIPDKK